MTWSRWRADGRGDRRLNTWQDVLRREMVDVRLRLPDPGTFQCSLSKMSLGDTKFIRFSSTPHAVEHDRSDGSSGCDHLMISTQLSGVTRIRSGRLELDLRPGDVGLLDTARPFVNEFRGATSRAIVLIDKRRVPLTSDNIPLGRMSSANPYFGIVRQHVMSLADPATDHSPQVAEALISSLTMLLTEFGMQSIGKEGKTAAKVTVRDVDAFISLNVFDEDLSASMIAARMGLSLRSLFALYEQAGDRLEQAIINARLRRGAELLAAQECANFSLTTISAMVGFKDTSHFSRRFRTLYGESPSIWRMKRS
jgi:AraC-like DNA-binding protein